MKGCKRRVLYNDLNHKILVVINACFSQLTSIKYFVGLSYYKSKLLEKFA